MKQFLAKRVLAKTPFQPIFFVGSWGKSMAMMASLAALGEGRAAFDVPSLPDAIASAGGTASPWRALFGHREYPKNLLLEVQERTAFPKDFAMLINDPIIVMTGISEEERQAFADLKKYLVKRCPFINGKNARLTVIYNADVTGLREVVVGLGLKRSIGFGIDDAAADLRATNFELIIGEERSIDQRVKGFRCKLQSQGSSLPVRIVGGIGRTHLYAALAGLALAQALGSPLLDAVNRLAGLRVLPGRMTLIPGIKKSLLIDDSYDASVESTLIALQETASIAVDDGKKKIAVVGEILGLGSNSDAAHCLIGQAVAEGGYDMLVGIGEHAADIIRCAEEAGMSDERTFHFNEKEEAGKFIQHELRQGEIVLIKGAKEDGMESIVKELMAFPLQAKTDLIQR